MSKIGKAIITVPAGVTAAVEGQTVKVKGPKGALQVEIVEEIGAKLEGNVISFQPRGETNRHKAMWGLSRTLVSNLVEGVTKGFEKKLEINGVGYKAAVQGKNRRLNGVRVITDLDDALTALAQWRAEHDN